MISTAGAKKNTNGRDPVVGDASANLGVHLSAHAGVVSGGTAATPLGRFCQVLLNLNEFVYVP